MSLKVIRLKTVNVECFQLNCISLVLKLSFCLYYCRWTTFDWWIVSTIGRRQLERSTSQPLTSSSSIQVDLVKPGCVQRCCQAYLIHTQLTPRDCPSTCFMLTPNLVTTSPSLLSSASLTCTRRAANSAVKMIASKSLMARKHIWSLYSKLNCSWAAVLPPKTVNFSFSALAVLIIWKLKHLVGVKKKGEHTIMYSILTIRAFFLS